MTQAKRILGIIAGLAVLFAAGAAAYDNDEPHAFKHAAPGSIDYYVLVLGWSPTYCLKKGDDRGDPQCNADRSYDFVLHGLWPQYARGWPEDCYDGRRPWVPADVIGEMRDIMPSKSLIIHEYTTHGTCTGLSPEKFYDAARNLYGQVTVPASFDDPETQRFLSPETIEAAFIAANDWLKPDMIAVTCRRGKLFGVRLCFSTDLAPQACGANINQKRLCPLKRIAVPAP